MALFSKIEEDLKDAEKNALAEFMTIESPDPSPHADL
jgi:hypothetical protein